MQTIFYLACFILFLSACDNKYDEIQSELEIIDEAGATHCADVDHLG